MSELWSSNLIKPALTSRETTLSPFSISPFRWPLEKHFTDDISFSRFHWSTTEKNDVIVEIFRWRRAKWWSGKRALWYRYWKWKWNLNSLISWGRVFHNLADLGKLMTCTLCHGDHVGGTWTKEYHLLVWFVAHQHGRQTFVMSESQVDSGLQVINRNCESSPVFVYNF